MVSIPKIKNIKFVVDRKPEGTIKSATVSKTPTGKYFISILVNIGLHQSNIVGGGTPQSKASGEYFVGRFCERGSPRVFSPWVVNNR